MPELPEVETVKRGLQPHLENQVLQRVDVFQKQLRWPIDEEIFLFSGKRLINISRRSKYLIFDFNDSYLMIHLGMSGTLKLTPTTYKLVKHDHVRFQFKNFHLIYHDPRRFGCVLVTKTIENHPRLSQLGPEPLTRRFDSRYLHLCLQKYPNHPIKTFIMNNKFVVGVGNIYASEALFRAKIHPHRRSGEISEPEAKRLTKSIKETLRKAIQAGGTTLKDFSNIEGKPGYFVQKLKVYQQDGQPCGTCGTLITKEQQANRATYYCSNCQS